MYILLPLLTLQLFLHRLKVSFDVKITKRSRRHIWRGGELSYKMECFILVKNYRFFGYFPIFIYLLTIYMDGVEMLTYLYKAFTTAIGIHIKIDFVLSLSANFDCTRSREQKRSNAGVGSTIHRWKKKTAKLERTLSNPQNVLFSHK